MSSANYPTPQEYQNQGGQRYSSDPNERYPLPSAPPGQAGSTAAAARGAGSSPQAVILVVAVDEEDLYPDDDDLEVTNFTDKKVRMRFVRKVLGTVGLQLLFCTSICALCLFQHDIKSFLRGTGGTAILYTCMFFYGALSIAIVCFRVGRGKPNPVNITLLVITTILLSVLVGCVIVHYWLSEILIAAATTMSVVFIMTAISFHPKFDITGYSMYLFGAFFAVMGFSFFSGLLFSTGILPFAWETYFIIHLAIGLMMSVILALIMLLYLKMIVGGGRFQYEEEDWLMASVNLFGVIIFFFVEILRMNRLFR